MVLTEKQAHLLLHLLQDTLTKNVLGYLSLTHESRCQLLNEIINQQPDTLIQFTAREEKKGD